MTRRERLALFGFALFVAVGLMPQPAAAVSFLRVSYSVTGGGFNGPNLSGPITGGAVSFITNPGVTSLPLGYSCFPGPCGALTRVTLTGPAGNFTLLHSVGFSALNNLNTVYAQFYPRALNQGAPSAFRSGGVTPALPWNRNEVWFGMARFFNTGTPRPYPYHVAILGAEVQTVVPEPASATLLGVGLLGLAIGGGMRRLRRR